jgi:hypothetical protein
MENLVTLYRPTGPKDLALVAASGWRRWPPRLPEQPIFYPVTNEAYAREIAERWNVKKSGVGFVTRFAVRKLFLDRYERQVVGTREHEEYWIPAEELEAFNDAIVGRIEPEVPAKLDELGLIEAACLAASLVSSISEDYWCAGWLKGIGAESYRWAEAPPPVRCGPGMLDETDLDKLARLRRRLAPWWVEWVEAPGGVALVRASSFTVDRSAEA